MIPAQQVKVTLFCIFLAILAAIILEVALIHGLQDNRVLIEKAIRTSEENAKMLKDMREKK